MVRVVMSSGAVCVGAEVGDEIGFGGQRVVKAASPQIAICSSRSRCGLRGTGGTVMTFHARL